MKIFFFLLLLLPLEVFCYCKPVSQKLQCSRYQFSIKKLQENEALYYHINNILVCMCISYRTESNVQCEWRQQKQHCHGMSNYIAYKEQSKAGTAG